MLILILSSCSVYINKVKLLFGIVNYKWFVCGMELII